MKYQLHLLMSLLIVLAAACAAGLSFSARGGVAFVEDNYFYLRQFLFALKPIPGGVYGAALTIVIGAVRF